MERKKKHSHASGRVCVKQGYLEIAKPDDKITNKRSTDNAQKCGNRR